MNRYLTAYCLSMVFLFFSCEAPHENPLDPENPEYPYGTIQGKVETAAYPYNAISNTYVIWDPTNTLTYTDSSGVFTFVGIKPQDGWLHFQKKVILLILLKSLGKIRIIKKLIKN